MKNSIKKPLSLLLTVLMLFSAMPLTAFASDADLVALKTAIAGYESKMDGTVYDNMKDAYEKYITAKEYAYAYEFGNKTDLDLADTADKLTAATTSMASDVWSPEAVTSPTFNYGGVVPDEFASNVIYRSTPAVFGGHEVEAFKFKFIMPQNIVFIYDGKNDLKIPVMMATNNVAATGVQLDKAPLSFYTNDNAAPSGDKTPTPDNSYFQLENFWQGYHKLTLSGGPAQPSDFIWSNITWNNGVTIDNIFDVSNPVLGFNNYWNSYTSDADKHRGEKMKTGNPNVWNEYANVLKYQPTAASLGWNNGLQSVKLGWTGRSMQWNFLSITTTTDIYHYYYGTADSSNRFEANIYVIDYSQIEPTLKNKASVFLNFGFDSDSNKASKIYVKHELDSIFETIEDMQRDPTAGFSDSNYAERAATVAGNIQNDLATINSYTVTPSDISDYDNLAKALSDYKDVYTDNNFGGKYTAESFAAFKSAYQTSVAEAASVAENGFTSVSTYNSLVAAYKSLNVVTEPSGTSGTATYIYDDETGVVTINGPGAMEDYESGDESPFGNNPDITEIVIADDVTYIGANAFNGCNNLTKIKVPATATYGDGAFDGCDKLKEVIIVKGYIENTSAKDAPWQQPNVAIIRLGEDKDDLSLTGYDDKVFKNTTNANFYFYNPECNGSDLNNMVLGNNPHIHAYVPSKAFDYANTYYYYPQNFFSLGHEHVWIIDEVVDATCTKGGYTQYKCKYVDFCSATKKDDFINAKGHSFDAGEVTPATCTERGYTTVTCTVCGYSKKDKDSYVPALGHDFSGSFTPDYASPSMKNDATVYKHSLPCARGCGVQQSDYCSFVVDGTEVVGGQNCIKFKCSVCNGVYYYPTEAKEGEYSVFFFDTDNQPIGDPVSVKSGEKLTASQIPELKTDTEGAKYSWRLDGVDTNPADVAVYSTTIFRMHEELESYTVTYYDKYVNAAISTETVLYGKKPANVEPLKTDIFKTTDGHLIYKWENDVDPSSVVITSDTIFNMDCVFVEHNFTDTILDESTCTVQGTMSRYCQDCEYSITGVKIPLKEHTPVIDKGVAPTCTKSGTTDASHCAVCETVITEHKEIKPLGHKWNGGVVTKEATINAEGVMTYTCTVCKAVKNESIPKLTVADITPSDAVADKAPVNKSIKKPTKIVTVSLKKKKQLKITFQAVPGAQNYRVQYRAAGEKKWKYAWTNGKTVYFLKNLKANGLYEFQFAAYKKNAKGNWERGAFSKIARRYYFKHAIKKLTPGKGKTTVTWKLKKGATSYQIQYALKRNMKGGKVININNPKTSKYVIKGLKKGKTYFVRIRAIKKANKKNYIGEYSKRLKVKVK